MTHSYRSQIFAVGAFALSAVFFVAVLSPYTNASDPGSEPPIAAPPECEDIDDEDVCPVGTGTGTGSSYGEPGPPTPTFIEIIQGGAGPGQDPPPQPQPQPRMRTCPAHWQPVIRDSWTFNVWWSNVFTNPQGESFVRIWWRTTLTANVPAEVKITELEWHGTGAILGFPPQDFSYPRQGALAVQPPARVFDRGWTGSRQGHFLTDLPLPFPADVTVELPAKMRHGKTSDGLTLCQDAAYHATARFIP